MVKQLWILMMMAGLQATQPVHAAEGQSPNAIINDAATQITSRLEGRREFLTANPEELYTLVDEVLNPYFDIRYAGRLALGKHWKGASPAQRDRFIDAFYDFLVQSYADAVLKFRQDALTIYPPEGPAPEKRTIVKTGMRMDDGSQVAVNYSLRKSKAGWRVYDVRIEGVSYIQNYRNQFNAEIAALGIDAVTDRLLRETTQVRAAVES